MPDSQQPLSRAACRDYLDQTTFRLRPKDYQEKYPLWPGSVGLEIEMQPVVPPPSAAEPPARVILQGEGLTSAAILRAEARRHPDWRLETTDGDHGQELLLKVEIAGGDNFSFEPGGQVEFSSRPFPCLGDAVARMREMQGVLDRAFGERGVRFVQLGINPWHTVAELGLAMPKGRYRAMDRYYASLGEYGQRMMRQTCTVQVNLDFGPDEETLAKRYLASQLMAPVAAATFACSAVVDRAAAGVRCFRQRIWRHTDPTHTGLPGLARLSTELSREACIDTYLDFVLGANVVFVTALDYRVPAPPKTFGAWLESPIDGVNPTAADFATHLSLMFPEVRPRGFLELRSIDCQPRAFEAVPAAYTTGLLYHGPTLDALLALLLPRQGEIPALLARAEEALAHPTLAALARQVMDLAVGGFASLPGCFRSGGIGKELTAFKAHFTDRGRSPADDILDRMRADGMPWISYPALQGLEEGWAKLVDK